MIPNGLAIVPQYQDPQMLQTIKETVCKGASEAQFRMFIEVCKATGLNPFLKEIYYAPQIGVMASRDGYLRKANDHPQFDGMETRVERDDKNVPIKAVCSVWRKDRNHPVICEAYYSEYKKASQVWQQYPSAMIAKVAEVLALKRSFAINGVVTEEEVGEQGSKQAQADYLTSKGLEPYTAPPKPDVRTASEQHKALILETAKMLDEPPATTKTVEMRKAAEVAETMDLLKQAVDITTKTKPARKITADSIEIRKGFGNMKEMLRAVTGDDSIYRECLQSHGYDHSSEIPTKEIGRKIYLQMGGIHKGLVEEKKLRAELEHAQSIYEGEDFWGVLGSHGCSNIEDVLNLTSEPLEALRKDLKALGGAA